MPTLPSSSRRKGRGSWHGKILEDSLPMACPPSLLTCFCLGWHEFGWQVVKQFFPKRKFGFGKFGRKCTMEMVGRNGGRTGRACSSF